MPPYHVPIQLNLVLVNGPAYSGFVLPTLFPFILWWGNLCPVLLAHLFLATKCSLAFLPVHFFSDCFLTWNSFFLCFPWLTKFFSCLQGPAQLLPLLQSPSPGCSLTLLFVCMCVCVCVCVCVCLLSIFFSPGDFSSVRKGRSLKDRRQTHDL